MCIQLLELILPYLCFRENRARLRPELLADQNALLSTIRYRTMSFFSLENSSKPSSVFIWMLLLKHSNLVFHSISMHSSIKNLLVCVLSCSFLGSKKSWELQQSTLEQNSEHQWNHTKAISTLYLEYLSKRSQYFV